MKPIAAWGRVTWGPVAAPPAAGAAPDPSVQVSPAWCRGDFYECDLNHPVLGGLDWPLCLLDLSPARLPDLFCRSFQNLPSRFRKKEGVGVWGGGHVPGAAVVWLHQLQICISATPEHLDGQM